MPITGQSSHGGFGTVKPVAASRSRFTSSVAGDCNLNGKLDLATAIGSDGNHQMEVLHKAIAE